MLIDFQVKQLKQSQLMLFQKHIELGQDHLTTLISDRGVHQLCSLDLLDPIKEKEIKLGPEELTGTFTGSINSFLTTALGVWMGFSGFMGLTLSSKVLFQVFIVISAVVGASIGISNYHYTKRQIKNRINKCKLQDIEIYILDCLNEKKDAEMKDKIEEIKQLLKTLDIGYQGELEIENIEALQDSELCLKWLNRIENLLEDRSKLEGSEVYGLFKADLEEMRQKMEGRLHTKQIQDENRKRVPPIFRPLIDSPLTSAKNKQFWMRSNWKNLMRAGVPFLYGSFSSVFAYLGTAKVISVQLGWDHAYEIVNDPRARIVQQVVAISITLYLGFAFFCTNRKNFKRDQEIDRAQDILIKKKEKLTHLDNHLVKIKDVLACLLRFSKIPEVVEILLPLKR